MNSPYPNGATGEPISDLLRPTSMSTPQTVRYVLTRDVDAQRIHFSATFPERKDAWTLQLPTRRPGRYELGNFAQYVLWVEGVDEDGERMRLANKTSTRGPFLQASQGGMAVSCGHSQQGRRASKRLVLRVRQLLMYDLERQDCPPTSSSPTSSSPEEGGWALAVALPWDPGRGPRDAREDVQHLMDSPWMASPKLWHDHYREQGLDVHIWVHDTLPEDPARFVADHVAFTRAQLSYFGSFPVQEYHFLYLFPDRDVRHGVEHEDSTVIAIGPAERVRSEEGYMEILGIASHELYHAWNVKRIRPAEWTPYDFTGPCPSELGYVAEGVTTYMGDLFLLEAGIVDLTGWCALMTKLLERHLNNPGRLNMSVAASSFDTWSTATGWGCRQKREHLCRRRPRLFVRHPNHVLHGRQASLAPPCGLWERYGQPRSPHGDMYWDVLPRWPASVSTTSDATSRRHERHVGPTGSGDATQGLTSQTLDGKDHTRGWPRRLTSIKSIRAAHGVADQVGPMRKADATSSGSRGLGSPPSVPQSHSWS